MKKSLIFASVLAFAGLFASCQKENVVTPSEPAVEQNVITINTNGFKGEADIEPLEALADAVVIGEWSNVKLKKSVRQIIIEALRSIGNIIGNNYETPTHTLQYFGDGRRFGYAIDEIRQFSYNLSENDVPFIQIQFGNAEELKIKNLEIMPLSHFGFNRGTGHFNTIEVSDALVVKFSFKGNIHMLMIYSAAGNNIMAEEAPFSTGVEFGLEFGQLYIDEADVIEIYNYALENKQDTPLNAATAFLQALWGGPYDSYISSRFTLNNNVNEVELYLSDEPVVEFSWNEEFESATVSSGPLYFDYKNYFDKNAVIYFNSDIDIVEEAKLITESTTDCKKFIRNFIKAELFGCNESEGKSLSKEFDKLFNQGPEFPTAYGNTVIFEGDFYNGSSWNWVDYITRLAIGLEPTNMNWKPAFGIRPFEVTGTIPVELEGKFYSFSEIDEMSESDWYNFFGMLSELVRSGADYITVSGL